MSIYYSRYVEDIGRPRGTVMPRINARARKFE